MAEREEAAAAPAAVSDRLRSEIPSIIDDWLDRLRSEGAGGHRQDRLLDVYRGFGRSLLERIAARLEGAVPRDGGDVELDRAIARAAGEARKSDLATWQAVADLNRLLPLVLSRLKDVERGMGHEEVVCDVVGTAAIALTRVLEATAIRIQRERAETLASMTEVLVHELRNRLGAADTASRMLLNPSAEIDEDWLSRVSRLIKGSLDDSLRTVEDVRSLAATRANLEDPELRPVPIRRLLREVLGEMKPKAEAAGVRLEVEGALPDAQVDASRLRLILSNLLSNAVKYRDPEEPDPFVAVACELDSDGVLTLEVRDNGIGIEEEEMDGIFLHRFRGDHVGSIEGTGLGLAIVREAADQLDAEIDVDTEVGEGTSFRVRFNPLEDQDLEPSG